MFGLSPTDCYVEKCPSKDLHQVKMPVQQEFWLKCLNKYWYLELLDLPGRTSYHASLQSFLYIACFSLQLPSIYFYPPPCIIKSVFSLILILDLIFPSVHLHSVLHIFVTESQGDTGLSGVSKSVCVLKTGCFRTISAWVLTYPKDDNSTASLGIFSNVCLALK